jgi:hypothetical protein
MISDILCTLNVGIRQDWMHWVPSLFEQHSGIDKFNHLWAMMPPLPGFTEFNKPYTQVTQWSCKEMKALRHFIVSVFLGTFSTLLASKRIPFTKALLCVKNLVCLHLMALYQYHTAASINLVHGELY